MLHFKDIFLKEILGKCPFCYGQKNMIGGTEHEH